MSQIAVQAEINWLKAARPNQLAPHDDWTLWLLLAGRGYGKALALDTPVLTTHGLVPIGEIQDGDELFDETGTPCRVVKAHAVLHGRPCYKMTFDDGTTVVCDREHLWPVVDRETRVACKTADRDWMKYFDSYHHVKTTGQLQKDYILPSGMRNYVIPNTKPVRFRPSRLNTLDPYLLGCWLGDGSSEANRITVADNEIIMAFKKAGYTITVIDSKGAATTYGITVNKEKHSFQSALKYLGVWGNKHVPNKYLNASIDQRLALLQGLMDTDGHAGKTGVATFVNTNERLARQCYFLVCSLGFKAHFSSRPAKMGGREYGTRYEVSFAPQGQKVFRLKRKQAVADLYGRSQMNRRQARYITKIEEVPSVPVRCLTVDSRNRLFLCTESLIPTHNTRTGAEKTRKWATFLDGARIGIMGPTLRDTQKTLIEGESGLLNIIPEQLIVGYNQKSLEIKLWNGSLIQGFTAEEPERLRGPQFHRFWLDEPAAMSRLREVKAQIAFSLRLKHERSPRTQQIWSTTPRPVAIVRELLKDAAQPDSLTYVTRGSSYENKANLTPEFFAELVKEYEGTALGRQEIHAEVIDASESGIFKKKWLKCWPLKNGMPRLQFVLLSFDTAFTAKTDNDPTACTIWGVFRDPATQDPGVMLLGCWRENLEYPELKKRAVEMANRFFGDTSHGRGMRPSVLLIEEKGSGISLIQDLRRAGLPVRAYNPGNADKISRAHVVSPLVRDGFVYLPENPKAEGEFAPWTDDLVEELTCFPGVEHDDYTDTFTQMLAMVRDMAYIQSSDRADDWDDEPDDDEDGGKFSFSAYKNANPYAG